MLFTEAWVEVSAWETVIVSFALWLVVKAAPPERPLPAEMVIVPLFGRVFVLSEAGNVTVFVLIAVIWPSLLVVIESIAVNDAPYPGLAVLVLLVFLYYDSSAVLFLY